MTQATQPSQHDEVDLEAALSYHLRRSDAIAALIADRVYTRKPNDPTWPLLLLKTIGGATIYSDPLWLETSLIQFDAYGGTRKEASHLAAKTRRVLNAAIGATVQGATLADVKSSTPRQVLDPSYTPARNRYIFDVTVTWHPTRQTAKSGH